MAALRPQQQRSIPITTPAPYKGLNTIDSLAAMDPGFGLSLQNWIATPQGLSLRKGFRKWATNLPTNVTSLLPYNGRNSTSSKLFAVSGGAIYDVSIGGDMTSATPVQSGLSTTNVYWQSVSQTYSTGATNHLVCVNGADAPRIYDGSSWITASQVASPSGPGQFTTTDNNGASVNMNSFVDVCLHNQRLWFVRTNSTVAYYLPIASVGGQLNAFDFGPFFPNGGRLHKLAAWTIDAGAGTAQYLVAISSEGDVAVFQGTNVASSTTWGILGMYKLGSPVGQRCVTMLQGDLLILTQDGLYGLSKYMQLATLDRTQALTYFIAPTISGLVQSLADTPGFEVVNYPGENVLLLNVPQATQANNFQFCFQTIQKGWTQFTGWPAQCFSLFNDALYFGGTNYVALSFIGYKDNSDITGVAGDNILGTALTAFTSFATEQLGPGLIKHVKMVKPFVITGQSNPTISIGVNTDFNLVPIVGSATVNPVTGAVWDGAHWDLPGSTWVGSLTTFNQWATPLCYPATFCALALTVSAVSDTTWTATNWIVAPSNSQFG